MSLRNALDDLITSNGSEHTVQLCTDLTVQYFIPCPLVCSLLQRTMMEPQPSDTNVQPLRYSILMFHSVTSLKCHHVSFTVINTNPL